MATEHDHSRRSVNPLWATNAALQAKVNRLEAENLKLYIQNVSMRFKLEVEKSRDVLVNKSGRPLVGDKPMSPAERQRAHRARVKARTAKQPTGGGGEPG